MVRKCDTGAERGQMTVGQYIENHIDEKIEGIDFPCRITFVNSYRCDNVYAKQPFEGDTTEYLDFFERKNSAIEELKDDMDKANIHDVKSALKYYKDFTEDGNSNYYGGMLMVYTNTNDYDRLEIGVRMD